MTSRDRQILLKIFSGPHAGAEIVLRDGEYWLGTDDACDIILGDQLLAPRHVRLVLQGDQWTCEAAPGTLVQVDGQSISSTLLRPFQFVTVGGTHLALGPADQSWNAGQMPPLIVPAEQTENANNTSSEDPSQASNAAVPLEPAIDSQPKQQASTATAPTRRRWLVGMIAALSLIGLALWGWGIWQNSAKNGRETAAREISPRAELLAAVAELPNGSALTIDEQNGRLSVQGFVNDRAERRTIEGALRRAVPQVRLKIVDNEGLVASARNLFRALEVDYQAVGGVPGELIVSGNAPSSDEWKRVREQLTKDVARLGKLTDRVAVAGTTIVQIVPKVETPVATAPDTPQEPSPLQVGEIPATQPTAVDPELPPEPVAEPPRTEFALDMSLKSVSIGSSRLVILENGQRIFPGGMMPNGYVVTAIEPNQVVLRKGTAEYVVHLGTK